MPENYDPFQFKHEVVKPKFKKPIDPKQRGKLLGEKEEDQFSKMPKTETAFLLNFQNKFVSDTIIKEKEIEFSEDIPFKNDKEMMERFKGYVAERNGFKISGLIPNNMMKASELINERKLFQEIYEKMYKKETNICQENSENTSTKEEQKCILKDNINNRVISSLNPAPLLCALFGIVVKESINIEDINAKWDKKEKAKFKRKN